MTGCIPLTETQVNAIADGLSIRDKALLYLGVTTGLRVSEMLSLTVGDVWNGKDVADSAYVARKSTKKKVEGKSVGIIEPARRTILAYLKTRSGFELREPLFLSRKGIRKPISRQSAHAVIADAAKKSGVTGKIGTHSMRKTYAKKVYEATKGDYMRCKLALGHKSVASTEAYLQFIEVGEINAAIEWGF